MEGQRTYATGQFPVTTVELDQSSFYQQHSYFMEQALQAVTIGDEQAVSEYVRELDYLRTTNPVLSRELEIRWENTDSDL